MKGLIIRSPHIDNILAGKKTWELRGASITIRGRIALIKAGTKTVIGYADLVDCLGPFTQAELNQHVEKHQASGETSYDMTFAWVLKNPETLEKPIPYKHPLGAITWVNL